MKIYWDGKSKNIIGPKIKELRKGRKLTQKALAEKLQLEGYEFSDLTILDEQQHLILLGGVLFYAQKTNYCLLPSRPSPGL